MAIEKELIEKVSAKLNKATQQTAQLCSQRYRHDQPSVFDFLNAVTEQSFNDAEKEWVFYLAVLVNEIYFEKYGKIKEISHVQLEAQAGKVFKEASSMQGKGADEFLTVSARIKKGSGQPLLADYIISALNVSGEEEAKGIRRENIITVFLFLIIIINSYEAALNGDAL